MQYSRGGLFVILTAKYIVLKCQRPLWVISGHLERRLAMSASPPRADMLIVGINACYVP